MTNTAVEYDNVCNGRFYLGDNTQIINHIPDDSIDLTVTSPPYDDLRKYHGSDGWTWLKFKKLADHLYRVTKDGGVLVWNVSDATIKGSETGSSFRQHYTLWIVVVSSCTTR